MSSNGSKPGPGLVGVGYEGRLITEFVEGLSADGITRLADVRQMPLSRKRGFSKSALTEALAEAGIAYEHHRALGNPKDNRAGFSGTAHDLARARASYGTVLATPDARSAISRLADLARRERVAVLCFETDQERCHRDLVLAAAAEALVPVR